MKIFKIFSSSVLMIMLLLFASSSAYAAEPLGEVKNIVKE